MEKLISAKFTAQTKRVLLKDEGKRNRWPMARVIGIKNDFNKHLRIVTLQVVDKNVPGRTLTLQRPITKNCTTVQNEKFYFPTEVAQMIGQDECHLGGAK